MYLLISPYLLFFIFMMRRRRRKTIDIDEVFADTKNAPGFHRENFEGTLERPVTKQSFFFLGIFFFIMGSIFMVRLGSLQLVRGAELRERSERNYLRIVTETPERGLIYDRFGVLLASNTL